MADEYISREAFKAEALRLSTHYLNEWDTLGVLAAADRIPAADVAPVVRCRDCKHSYKFRGDLRRCTRHTEGVPGRPIVVEDDDFCCWGRKIEEGHE